MHSSLRVDLHAIVERHALCRRFIDAAAGQEQFYAVFVIHGALVFFPLFFADDIFVMHFEAEVEVGSVVVSLEFGQRSFLRIPWEVETAADEGDKVLFIDKHAAHERMNFDRMKAAGYDPMAQTLLSPMVCRLAPEEHAALLSHLPLLEEFGFGVEDFGGGALVVRQAPFDVDPGDIEATLTEIAQKLLTTGTADPGAARDELLHTMACKAAIKGGWKTSPQELERVAQAVMSGQVKYCPHGRPVAIELTRQQLEKQFKRS